jgi:uncharacterized protein DUF6916
MRNLTEEDFSGRTGTDYEVRIGETAVPLTLEEMQPLPDAGREGGSFRLTFAGPRDPVLEQAIYAFRSGDETFDIFIVPIARDDQATRYEAVFF